MTKDLKYLDLRDQHPNGACRVDKGTQFGRVILDASDMSHKENLPCQARMESPFQRGILKALRNLVFESKTTYIPQDEVPPSFQTHTSKFQGVNDIARKCQNKKMNKGSDKEGKMVVVWDIGLDKVEGLMKLTSVDYFMGKEVKGGALKNWLDIG